MAKRSERPAKLAKGANRAQVREFLFQLFSQGQPARSALDKLKSARDLGEATRALRGRRERAGKSSDGARERQDEE